MDFKTFFEAYDLELARHQNLAVIYPFDGTIWTKENTKLFNKMSSMFPQSQYCITIAAEGQNDTTIKRRIIEACGIHPTQVIECKNPFEPYKVIKLYDNKKDVIVLLLDDEQIKQIKNKKLFQKYSKSGNHLPYGKCIYYVRISSNGSKYELQEIVNKYNQIPDIVGKKQFVERVFGCCDFDIVDKLLNLGINAGF